MLASTSSRVLPRLNLLRPAARSTSRVMSTTGDTATFSFGESQARYYEETLVEGIFKPWSEAMFSTSRPVVGDAVLDIATGTGVVAHRVAEIVGETGRVLGVDNSSGMLAQAKAKEKSRGPNAGAMSWMEADAMEMTLPAHAFDRAYCQQGLQFMTDPTETAKRVLKALKPGGHFTCAIWTHASAEENQIMYHLGEALRDVGCERFVPVAVKPMSWSRSRPEGAAKIEDVLIAAGFINPDVCVEDGDFTFKDLTSAVEIAKVGPYGEELASDSALWTAFAENFSRRLAPFIQSDGSVVVPARSFVGHGVAPWN